MEDRTIFDLPSEGPTPARGHPAPWGLIARCALALLVGAAVMWAIMIAMILAFFALAVRHDAWRWAVVALFFALPPVTFVSGGVAARLAGRVNWRPGWLGVGAAWLHALSAFVLPLNRILTPPPGIPVLPPPSPKEAFEIHIPGWVLTVTVCALLAYGGDRLVCYLGRRRRGRGTAPGDPSVRG